MTLPRKRHAPTCAPDHECTDEEINEIIVEIKDVQADPTITHYEFPTLQEMNKILEISENYAEGWYHSSVVLKSEESLEDHNKNSPEFMTAYNQIKGNSWEFGIFLSYWVDVNIKL